MNAKSYVLHTVLSTAILVLIVLALNYTIDPYGIIGARRIAHLNQYKVDINDYTGLLKKYQPQFGTYNGVIVGNSRAEMGIDPAHLCFRSNDMNVYNLGMPGSDLRTQLAYTLNLMYREPIKYVFLAVDFVDFISTWQAPSGMATLLQQSTGDLKYLPSGESNPAYNRVWFMDYYRSLFSLDALTSSVKTILLQDRVAPDRNEAGFNPGRDFEEAVRIEGPRALFDQKMQSLQVKYGTNWYLRNADGELGLAFDDFTEFLDIASARGVKVYLFTHPFHESFWNLMRDQGLLPLYHDWMQSMEVLVRNRGEAHLTLWDFSGDSPYIHEVVPEAGVKSGPLRWFWEPAHYRRQLGDLMINEMLSENCNRGGSFGRKVF